MRLKNVQIIRQISASPRLQQVDEPLKVAVVRLEESQQVDLATYAALLRRCGRERDLLHGRRIHTHILAAGHGEVVFLLNLLVDMYGRCSNLVEAKKVFDLLDHRRNLYSWSAMIAAYARCGYSKTALELFHRMDCEGVRANGLTFVSVLGACCKLRDLIHGHRAHQRIISSGGFFSNIAVANSLLSMYASCGLIDRARAVFDAMVVRNVVSWNCMIGVYVQAGHLSDALELFHDMKVEPDRVTYVTALGACAGLGDVRQGEIVHEMMQSSEVEFDAFLGTSLLNFYSKVGYLDRAKEVFDAIQQKDCVSWSAMIAAYAQNGQFKAAVELLWKLDNEGIHANQVTFISVVDACSDLGDLRQGRKLHSRILELGFDNHITVKNTLLNLYSNLGSLEDTEKVFHSRAERNSASWNAMIAAYTRHGQAGRAVRVLECMDCDGLLPDAVTLSGIFDACAETGDICAARKLHFRLRGSQLKQELLVGNSLISMYSRCWSLAEAEKVFQEMKRRDLISWNSIIASYAMHGVPEKALELYRELNLEGYPADNFTFTSTLFACSHAGLLREGLQVFGGMVQDYGGLPSSQHYGCIVDLLGRLGKLGEAENLMESMPLEPDSVAWMAVFSACKTQSD